MKTTNVLSVIFVLFLISTFSCNQQDDEWKGTIEEIDGITIVKNPKEGLRDLKEKANVRFIKEHQIGELDGPAEFLFGYIVDVAVNKKGDIYVADRQLNEVRKFNKNEECSSSNGFGLMSLYFKLQLP